MKLVVNDGKNAKSYQKELADEKSSSLHGKKIGDSINGDLIELPGYSLKITGGSNRDGFPMRPDVMGTRKTQLWLSGPPGIRGLKKGERRMKTIIGNQVSKETAQLNAKVVTPGPKTLEELGLSAPGKKKEEKK
ncbi:30S ribosomal protein S6e [Candidatus Micrarchaeota archaeon]|nr:30S ribosomal protein S6e [Candidatus Micrarchaeota archaeon]